jgi:hypothetical protein
VAHRLPACPFARQIQWEIVFASRVCVAKRLGIGGKKIKEINTVRLPPSIAHRRGPAAGRREDAGRWWLVGNVECRQLAGGCGCTMVGARSSPVLTRRRAGRGVESGRERQMRTAMRAGRCVRGWLLSNSAFCPSPGGPGLYDVMAEQWQRFSRGHKTRSQPVHCLPR